MVVIKEIVDAVWAWRIWVAIAVDDIQSRYRRTLFGPFWLTGGQAALIFGLYYLNRSGFGGVRTDYLPFLAASLPTWSLLTSFLVDGSGSLVRAKGLIESYPLPMAIHLLRSVASAFIVFAHTIVVFIIVALFARLRPSLGMLGAAPGLALVAMSGLGFTFVLGPLGSRYRDLMPAISAATTMLFVLTPVFWVPTEAQRHLPLVYLNPLYYLMEVVRAPLIGNPFDPGVWAGASLIAIVSMAGGIWSYGRLRSVAIYYL